MCHFRNQRNATPPISTRITNQHPNACKRPNVIQLKLQILGDFLAFQRKRNIKLSNVENTLIFPTRSTVSESPAPNAHKYNRASLFSQTLLKCQFCGNKGPTDKSTCHSMENILHCSPCIFLNIHIMPLCRVTTITQGLANAL